MNIIMTVLRVRFSQVFFYQGKSDEFSKSPIAPIFTIF